VTQPQTLAVALSGGIDSLVAAFLLKQKGHPLFGLNFRTGFDGAAPDLERLSAMLGIPVLQVDLSREFRSRVVDYFTGTYLQGKTPNPCLFCNRSIKFGALLEAALDMGASGLATGHYAGTRTSETGAVDLVKAEDKLKDQSYFLSLLNQDQLRRCVFPLGGMTKEEVRRTAAREGLVPLHTRESQDVCFIGDGQVWEFVEKISGLVPGKGPIVTRAGDIVGEHHGLHRFTIGQRRGINCPGPRPLYVLALDTAANRLVVGAKSELHRTEIDVSPVNMISRSLSGPTRVLVRIRYNHAGAGAILLPRGPDSAKLLFDAPQLAVTPGQAAVFYLEDTVLGAGIIQ
jgi:tRNA-specific 2-thiouridylase